MRRAIAWHDACDLASTRHALRPSFIASSGTCVQGLTNFQQRHDAKTMASAGISDASPRERVSTPKNVLSQLPGPQDQNQHRVLQVLRRDSFTDAVCMLSCKCAEMQVRKTAWAADEFSVVHGQLCTCVPCRPKKLAGLDLDEFWAPGSRASTAKGSYTTQHCITGAFLPMWCCESFQMLSQGSVSDTARNRVQVFSNACAMAA